MPERADRLSRPDGRHVPRVGRARAHVDAADGAVGHAAAHTARRRVGVARETAERNWGNDAEYVVLWNGIEIDRFASVTPTPSARPAVLFLGRHEDRKGLGVLLDAWDGIDRDADLWVAGTGPRTVELRKRGVDGVTWLGSVPDAERNARLRGATVFCAPSIGGESFGIVLLEAMAASTAIVASDIDGYQNVARGDRDVLLVPPGDGVALRDALRRLLDDPMLRERLVASGHERAAEFAMPRLAERYLELYERALGACVTDEHVEQLAIDVAVRVRATVAPALGDPGARAGVGVAPGGDVTMAIDEIAETVLAETCAAAGDIAFYSEDRRATSCSAVPRRISRRRSDRRHPARGRRSRVVLRVGRGRAAVRGRDARRRDDGRRARDQVGRAVRRRRGRRDERGGAAVGEHRSRRAVLDRGLRGRPAMLVTVALEELIDGSTMRGGYFDLGSTTFNMTRLVTGQLDAYVDIGKSVVERFPVTEGRFVPPATGAICTNFPYDVAAAALIVQEAGGVVTEPDGSPIDDLPAVGSGEGYAVAVLASASAPLHELLLAPSSRGCVAWARGSVTGNPGDDP